MSPLTVAPLLLMLVRSVLGLIFLFSILWFSYLGVRRTLKTGSVSSRWVTTLLVALVLQHGLLIALSAFHHLRLSLFRWYVALPIMLGMAAWAHRRLDGAGARLAFRDDLALASTALREIAHPWVHRLLMVATTVVAGTRALAGIVSPPLTWDTLTYHALKSAEWVQYGHQIRTIAPDQWGYCAFYPDAAEVPGAWAMLFLQGDLGLPWVGIGIWAACAFAVYALARALEARRAQAFRAALLIAFLPALLGEMVSGYSDMFVVFVFLALALFLVQVFQHRQRTEAVLLGAAAGLLANAKWSGVPLAGVALACSLAAPRSGEHALSRLRAFALAAGTALLVAGPHYLGVWMDSGSPFYPYTVRLGPFLLSPGNPQLRELFTGKLGYTDPRWASPVVFVLSLLHPHSLPKVEFTGFGPALLILIPMACWGLLALAGKRASGARGRVLSGLVLLLLGALPVLGILSKDFAGQRALWLPNLGRLLLPLPAALAVLGACVQGRAASVAFLLALAVTLPWTWPAGIGNPMLDAIAALAPWLALSLGAGTVLLLAFARLPKLQRKREFGVPAALGLSVLILVMPLARVRQESRYPIYEAAAAPVPAFIMQFTWPEHAAAWPLWRALDDGSPHRIHASFGWDGLGHNGLRTPLLGSHLQNRVLYVPITHTGAVIDTQRAAQLRQEADAQAWMARLREAKIDRIFFGHPAPPEAELVSGDARHFHLLARGQGNLHALYRFIP